MIYYAFETMTKPIARSTACLFLAVSVHTPAVALIHLALPARPDACRVDGRGLLVQPEHHRRRAITALFSLLMSIPRVGCPIPQRKEFQ
jgi:hypothetical protein